MGKFILIDRRELDDHNLQANSVVDITSTNSSGKPF